MRGAVPFLLLFNLGMPALAQQQSDLEYLEHTEDLGWMDTLRLGRIGCYLKMAEQLEPLQDSMYDLANLIVYSICTGQIYQWINSTEGGEQIDIEATFQSELRLVGQAIVAARLRRLGVGGQE